MCIGQTAPAFAENSDFIDIDETIDTTADFFADDGEDINFIQEETPEQITASEVIAPSEDEVSMIEEAPSETESVEITLEEPVTGTMNGIRAGDGMYTYTLGPAYSYTQNLTENGTQNSNYGNYWGNASIRGTNKPYSSSSPHVVTLAGAEQLNVSITYGGESSTYDWMCMWTGAKDYYYNAKSYYSSSLTGKLGGGNHTDAAHTKNYTVNGDTVSFSYYSNGSGCGDGYGYYAVITGTTNALGKLVMYESADQTNSTIRFVKTTDEVYPNTPYEKEGYTFLGYSYTPNADTADVKPGETIDWSHANNNGVIELYPVWGQGDLSSESHMPHRDHLNGNQANSTSQFRHPSFWTETTS